MATPNLYGLTGGCSNSLIKPIAPISFAAAAGEDELTVVLTWDITNADYERLTIDVSEDEVTWTQLGGELMPDVETLTHEGLEDGVEYFYRMRCRKRFKWSIYYTDSAVALSWTPLNPIGGETPDFWVKEDSRSGLTLTDSVAAANATILPAVVSTEAAAYNINILSGVIPTASTIWVVRARIKDVITATNMGGNTTGARFNFGISAGEAFVLVWGDNSGLTGASTADTNWHTFILYDKRLWVLDPDVALTDAAILNIIATISPTITIDVAAFGTSITQIRYFNRAQDGLNLDMDMALSYIGTISTGVITWAVKHIFNSTYRIWDKLSNNSIAWSGGTPYLVYSVYGSSDLLDNGHTICHHATAGILTIPYVNGSEYDGDLPTGFVKVLNSDGDVSNHNLATSKIRFPLLSKWDRSNETVFKDAARAGFYDAANPTDWHITELNQLAINELFYEADQDICFVHMDDNSVDIEDRQSLRELFSYATAKTDSNLDKILKYTSDYNYFL